MKTQFQMTRAELLRSGMRGNATQKPKVLVDGAYFTYDEIAARTGLGREQARSRYGHHERAGRWPITWGMLGAQEG
jgi:hypothetical protein